MDTKLPPHVDDFLTEYFKKPQAITVDAQTEFTGPKLRVRISADYESSQKGLVPDITVEVEAPFTEASAIALARGDAVEQFKIAYNAVLQIIADGACKPEANHKENG